MVRISGAAMRGIARGARSSASSKQNTAYYDSKDIEDKLERKYNQKSKFPIKDKNSLYVKTKTEFNWNDLLPKVKHSKHSGYNSSKSGIYYDVNKKFKSKLFEIDLMEIAKYDKLLITLEIEGNFTHTKDNDIIIGLCDNKKYWMVERGDKKKHLWVHHGQFKNKDREDMGDYDDLNTINKYLKSGGGSEDKLTLMFSVNKNKKGKLFKYTIINGDQTKHWTLPLVKSPKESQMLRIIAFRNNEEEIYQIKYIKATIDSYRLSSKVDKEKQLLPVKKKEDKIIEKIVKTEIAPVITKETTRSKILKYITRFAFLILFGFVIYRIVKGKKKLKEQKIV